MHQSILSESRTLPKHFTSNTVCGRRSADCGSSEIEKPSPSAPNFDSWFTDHPPPSPQLPTPWLAHTRTTTG